VKRKFEWNNAKHKKTHLPSNIDTSVTVNYCVAVVIYNRYLKHQIVPTVQLHGLPDQATASQWRR